MIDSDASLADGSEYKNVSSRYYYDSQKHVVPVRLWKRVNAKQENLFEDRFHGKVHIGQGWYKVNFFRLVGHQDFSEVKDPDAGIDGDDGNDSGGFHVGGKIFDGHAYFELSVFNLDTEFPYGDGTDETPVFFHLAALRAGAPG